MLRTIDRLFARLSKNLWVFIVKNERSFGWEFPFCEFNFKIIEILTCIENTLNIVRNRWSIDELHSRTSLVPSLDPMHLCPIHGGCLCLVHTVGARKLARLANRRSLVYQRDRSNRLSYERRSLARKGFFPPNPNIQPPADRFLQFFQPEICRRRRS